ncbi:hypothetical protein GUJ93_ZPchr0012g22129 [Zizania palustris]|uniref:Uncharacterized protein n=1 Tax=Zizania palustris TaxID=103762 RepID=A0A8J5WPW4_ZIZPA|nr:hypothetical protein GUJ93_ZPchr0012g22129 [Zizania palustris]
MSAYRPHPYARRPAAPARPPATSAPLHASPRPPPPPPSRRLHPHCRTPALACPPSRQPPPHRRTPAPARLPSRRPHPHRRTAAGLTRTAARPHRRRPHPHRRTPAPPPADRTAQPHTFRGKRIRCHFSPPLPVCNNKRMTKSFAHSHLVLNQEVNAQSRYH